MKFLRAAGILLMAATLGLTGCIKPVKEPIERTGIHFDTVINLKIYDTDDISLLDDCFKFCEEFEHTVSRTLETSEIYQINHSNGNPVEVSKEMYMKYYEVISRSDVRKQNRNELE